MKGIKCPACGRPQKTAKYCIECGCYLSPLLEEEITQTYIPTDLLNSRNFVTYSSPNIINNYMASELTNVANNLNYEMEQLQSQINAEYIKLSQSMQTRYLTNSLNYYHDSAERDINGRIKRPGDYK